MDRFLKLPWVGVSIYHEKGDQYTMGRGIDIPWIGGWYAMVRGLDIA
jgi:hypothetical protein